MMIPNKTTSAVRSAINTIQRYKVLNVLTHDCFDKALETEQKLSIENKSKTSLIFIELISKICIFRQFSIVWSSNFNQR
jgi:hypothetical protein